MPLFLLLSLLACGPKYQLGPLESGLFDTGLPNDPPGEDTAHTPADTGHEDTGEPEDTEDTEDTDQPEDTADDALWGQTSLRILSPSSGAFLALGEDASYEARVYDGDGEEMDFEDIAWSSSADADWAPMGASFTDATLGAGDHVITATAHLPNGDRLAYAIGDVLVQSAWAGTYAGTLTLAVTMEYDGVPYTVGGAGGATLTIDPEGVLVTGSGECVVNLMGYEMAMTVDVDMENLEGSLDGEAAADLYIMAIDFDATGTVSEDGELEITFDDDILGYAQVSGSITATRVSRDTTGG